MKKHEAIESLNAEIVVRRAELATLATIQNWMDCCGDRGCCGEPEDGWGAIVTIDGVQWQGYGETPGLAVLNTMEYRAYSLTGEWPDGGGQHHEP